MSGTAIFWLGGLVLAALLLAKGTAAGKGAIAAALLVAPAVLLACFWSADGIGDFRLRLQAVTLDQTAAPRPLSLGGDPARDDLVLAGIPPGIARLAWNAAGKPQWTIDVTATTAAGDAGVVQATNRQGVVHIVGSRDLSPGDIMCLARCGAPDALSLQVRPDGSGLQRLDDADARLPPFKVRPLLRRMPLSLGDGWRTWSPAEGIFPLRDYGVAWNGVTAGALTPCRGRFLCAPGSATPVRSFIYRDGGGALRVLLLDPGARLLRGGREIHRTPERPLPLAPDVTRVSLFSISYGSAFDDLVAARQPTSRLRPRGSFDQRESVGKVHLALAREAVVPIERPDIEAAQRALSPGSAQLAISLLGAAAHDGEDAAENPVRVPAIGGLLGRSIESRLLLTRAGGFGRSGTEFAVVGGPAVRLGMPFSLGTADGRQAVFGLERLDAPWLVVLAAFLWALVLGQGRAACWRENRLALLIVAATQWLLALRLLIGLESAALNPQLDIADTAGANALAYFLVPLLLAMAIPGDRESRRPLWPAILFCAAIWAGIWWQFGWNQVHWFGILILAAGILYCAPPAWLDRAGPARRLWPVAALAGIAAAWWFAGIIPAVLVALGAVLAWQWPRLRALSGRGAGFWMAIVAALVIVRLGAVPLGYGERIGWWVNVSIFYVPPLILAAAGLFFAARSIGPKRAFWWGAGWSLLLIVGFAGLPWLAGDQGAAIYFIPVLAMGWFAARDVPGEGRRRWLYGWSALPAAALALGALLLVLNAYQDDNWNRRLDVAIADSQGPDATVRARASAAGAALLAERNEDRMDSLRLWTAFAPERVANSGTNEAESQRRVAAILGAYTSSFAGHGYMARSDPGEIRNYQADDNLGAVHIMGPFGRAGAMALLLVLGMLAWAGGRIAATDWLALAGQLALWTIFATATYMILANLQLLPFTGRNIYLLAALSKSDLVEGSILLLIALRGLTRRAA